MTIKVACLQFGPRGWAIFCLPIMLLSLGVSIGSAQCSQATRPEAASSAKPNKPVQDSLSSTASLEFSSSSDTANAVRFITGNAVTVLENTPLQVMNDMPISSRTTKVGAMLSFTVTRDVIVGGILVIPCGATVLGKVVSAKQAGRLAGSSNLTLELTALNLNGKSYRLYTTPFKVVGASKTRPTVHKIASGAAVGAVAMDADIAAHDHVHLTPEERLRGEGIAAGMGAGVGLAIAESTPPSIARIPAESQMDFTLASPIAVYPVDQRTAARLGRGMFRGGPVLYVRGESQ
ncbi:MAG TPA: hypothetical protein VFU55_08765 [Terracidiphilus sp.]|nr:hypothetical protein [Terracidiphilus sp.]